PDEIDEAVPAERLGFDPVSRAGLIERLNREVPASLGIEAFPIGTSLAGLAAVIGTPTAVIVTPPAVAENPRARAEEYLKRALAAGTGLPVERIRTRVPLQDYGIESVLIEKLNRQLAEDFGELPRTLFFEHRTIHELAGYLATN